MTEIPHTGPDRESVSALERNILQSGLHAICTTGDSGPWIDVYRKAGGGYEGLQKIAEEALKQAALASARGE
jgi:hypothetical protein